MLPDVALLWDMTLLVQQATSAWEILVALGSPGDILHWQLVALALPRCHSRAEGSWWEVGPDTGDQEPRAGRDCAVLPVNSCSWAFLREKEFPVLSKLLETKGKDSRELGHCLLGSSSAARGDLWKGRDRGGAGYALDDGGFCSLAADSGFISYPPISTSHTPWVTTVDKGTSSSSSSHWEYSGSRRDRERERERERDRERDRDRDRTPTTSEYNK